LVSSGRGRISWLFFKARAKRRPYLDRYEPSEQRLEISQLADGGMPPTYDSMD
jgi:hypothetical protein